ncbi:hypothetical protein LTR56_002779 [Elasticomyces elasticus]|nr:hypothetical protein LTR56_002779 [Elasticomyces elasticus]KAK3666764.1 hypothetical protein LTR22_002351 [Elasticomyces elasticus]KAK4920393.1 hypothetical protein LTR49_011985 [Elasticomyces elasticus]KAK5759319.1 hypothetical protein LTS12_010642 [Elasticomyces elasticus]
MAQTEKDETQISLAKKLDHVPWGEHYERMISGMLYDAFVPELTRTRMRARHWCQQYNNSFPADPESDSMDTLTEARLQELRKVLGRVGEEAYVEPPFFIDYGCNISLGDRFYSNFNFTVLDCGLVTIGDRVLLGPNVSIYAATHETEVQSRRDNVEFTKPVTIGDDCWIGGGAIILPGVEIGQGTTIAAGSVVTKSIPAWSVAMGSPAKVVKNVTPLDAHNGTAS